MNFHKINMPMICRSIIVLIFPLMIYSTGSFAETTGLPILTKAAVKAIIIQQSTGIYEYHYTVQNLTDNQAELWNIDIDVTYPKVAQVLSDEGLTNGSGYLTETSKGVQTLPDTPKMIPIGLWSPPNWISGLGRDGMGGWASMAGAMLKSSEAKEGFMMLSHGLPSIRIFKSSPWIDVDTLYPSIDTLSTQEELDALGKRIKDDEYLAAFKGKTLGPTAPPANFVALDFVNYIIDLKHQASALGWITNPGVQDSLDVKLDQVKNKLQAGDTKTAANVLNAFLNEVDAQGCSKYDGCPAGKHLLPEAWALLKFNGQYLLGKL